MSDEADVRSASERFYAALNAMLNGDPDRMDDVWSHADDVSTMHPLGGRETGWQAVRDSWHNASKAFSSGSVEARDVVVRASGDLAYTLDVERVGAMLGEQPFAGEVRATNIYRREAGGWKIVHHHADAHVGLQSILGIG